MIKSILSISGILSEIRPEISSENYSKANPQIPLRALEKSIKNSGINSNPLFHISQKNLSENVA